MAGKRSIFIEVDEDRADELIEALSKRSYINVALFSPEEKRKRRRCPCCDRVFARDVVYAFTDAMLEALLTIVYKMHRFKTVVIVNSKNPIEILPPVEHQRVVEVDERLMVRALGLGAVKKFYDGRRDTYFVTHQALMFLRGDQPFVPAEKVYYEGKCIEERGSITLEEVRFKDLIRRESYLREARKAVKSLSPDTLTFVEKGQLSLIDFVGGD